MGSIASDHSSCSNHVLLFPFMSKGHIIPLLHLARLLLRRPSVAVTVITTPANRPFISNFLCDTPASVIDIPFPENVPGIAPGVESTDKFSSMSLFVPFTRATKLMQPDFEGAVEALPRVSFMVSDGFLWWTLESAAKFGFPRFVFYGMSNYCWSVCRAVSMNRLLFGAESDDELITVTRFPWIQVTRNDFDPPFRNPERAGDPYIELLVDQMEATSKSHGMIGNSFYELEPVFVEYLNREAQPKVWCVGPLCLADSPRIQHQPHQKSTWIQWLDKMLDQGRSVLYVAFGTQAEMSSEQLKEIASGLKESKVSFLWVTRKQEVEIGDGLEERGMTVREWVDQREILMHPSVQGFLSHCGWNSVMESICAGVAILAWPMMADQPVNARMVVEEIKVGLRVETCNGSVKGFVKKQGLVKMVKELMEGEKGEEVRKKVREYSEMAKKAMEEKEGSSWRTLDLLLTETAERRIYAPGDKVDG